MHRRDTTTLTFSQDPFRGVLFAMGWADVSAPSGNPRDPLAEPDEAQGTVVPHRETSPARKPVTTITRIHPDREPMAS